MQRSHQQPAGVTSSVPCQELEFGPSRHRGASYTMAMSLLRDREQAQVAERGLGEGCQEGGGGGGGRQKKGEKNERVKGRSVS